ncbi:MAG: RCC1 domain-containing protein [bacterium]|nr:RCC1 domain-containing protein [bacterium]
MGFRPRRLADPPDGQYTAVASGEGHACALTADGAIRFWGADTPGQTDPPDGQYTAITAGPGYTCALTADGAIRCWGGVPVLLSSLC